MGPRRYEIPENTHLDGFDSYNDHTGLKKRYDPKRLTLQEQQANRKGKNIFVYFNGSTEGGLKLCFNRKFHRTLEALMKEIYDRKAQKSTVRVDNLYCWPSGRRVKELSDIELEGQQVFVSTQYNKKLLTEFFYHDMPHEHDARYSSDTYLSNKPSPTSVPSSHASSQMSVNSQPIPIYVIYAKNRTNKQRIYCNPSRGFESLLEDIKGTLKMPTPCKALHPVRNTKEKVDSLSGLKMVVKNRGYDTFFAVGDEGLGSPRNLSPMRNGYNNYQHTGRSKNSLSRQNGYQNGDQMATNYDKGRDDYEDYEGRTYRRHQDYDDRQRLDRNNDDDMYTPRNDKYDRRRRDSPGRQSQSRRNDDRKEWRRDDRNTDEYDNSKRNQYDEYDNRDAYDDRGRNDYERRDDRGRDDRDRDQRSRFDRQRDRSEERENGRSRRDNSRNERGRNDRNADDSRARSGDRYEDKRRESDRGRRDESREMKGRNERDQSENRNDEKRRNSRKPSDGNANRRQSRDNRDDRSDKRNEERNNDTGRRDDKDFGREQTGSISPTDSEMDRRREDMAGKKEDYDQDVDF